MFSPLFLCVCLESCKQRLILKHQRRCSLFLKSKNKEFSFLSRPSWCSEGLRGAASSDHDTFSSWHFVRMSDILPSLSKPLGAAYLIFLISCPAFSKCAAVPHGDGERPADEHSCRWCRSVYLLNLLKQSAITESVQQRSGSPNAPDLADAAKKTNLTENNSAGRLQAYLLKPRGSVVNLSLRQTIQHAWNKIWLASRGAALVG